MPVKQEEVVVVVENEEAGGKKFSEGEKDEEKGTYRLKSNVRARRTSSSV